MVKIHGKNVMRIKMGASQQIYPKNLFAFKQKIMKLTARLCLMFLILCFFKETVASQAVTTSQGNLEFIGLEKWTPEEIQKALGYVSTDELHFCALDLKSKLKFPDAAVFRSQAERGFTRVVVVEPQNAHLVQYRSIPSGTVEIPMNWTPLIAEVLNEGYWKNPDALQKLVLETNRAKDFALAKKILLRAKSTEKRVAAPIFSVILAGVSLPGYFSWTVSAIQNHEYIRHLCRFCTI